jgi:ribosomal protein S18 acetylase RimI-like enzyme
MPLDFRHVDPQCADALALLRLAAVEARALYAEFHVPDAPWPTNDPMPPRGAYLVAYLDGQPIAMGAHRPIDDCSTEIRRMYTAVKARRMGAAKAVLFRLEAHARDEGFAEVKLETGVRQEAAMRLYESVGFRRIAAFGRYRDDPTSVCYAKQL